MKNVLIRKLAGLTALAFACASGGLRAEDVKAVERVTLKDRIVMAVQDGKTVELEKDATLGNGIKVMTNGTFTVNDGKKRELKEGQILGRDGMLTSPDGSITPVFDHVTMKAGKVIVVKDGESQPLDRALVLSDRSQVLPDGTLRTPEGRMRRLIDGQILQLDGAVLPAKDTITLQSGKVKVQKDGALVEIKPNQSITMNDGTRVTGDGTVIRPDGTKKTLAEGEIVTIEGVALKK